MKSSKIKIFIVDDHPLMRQALKASILTEIDMDVIGAASDGEEAIEMIPILKPDIVIMDLMMPNMDGLEAIKILTEICPDVPILTLSSLEREEVIFEAVQAGAQGYITKDVQHEELIDSIRVVSTKKPYLPEVIIERLMGGVRQKLVNEYPKKDIGLLTKREKEVLKMLGKGYSNAMIGQNMVISASTVRVHIHQIIKKMGFENRNEAVIFSTQQSLNTIGNKTF